MRQLVRGIVAAAALIVATLPARADTVASLLGNFTINQYCGLSVGGDAVNVHLVVVYGQLPALRELHNADANRDGLTSQAERDAYVGGLAAGLADGLLLSVDGVRVPLRPQRWASSLPAEQGGFSLRVDLDLSAALPPAPHRPGGRPPVRRLQLTNQNYPGRMGWHEMVVTPAAGTAIFATNAYSTSATDALRDALQALPPGGPLDERTVSLSALEGPLPAGAVPLAARSGGAPVRAAAASSSGAAAITAAESGLIARKTRALIDALSAPRMSLRVLLLVMLGALALGAVHALSPGHGKTLVGAYLIGSRGTPRHAAFLGLTVTVTHTLGVFVLGFATLYASRFFSPERLFPVLSMVSALLVLGMGIVLLIRRVRTARAVLYPGRSATDARPAMSFEAVLAPSAPGGLPAHSLVRGRGHSHHAETHSHVHDGTWHSHGGGSPHTHLPPGAGGERVTWTSLLTLGISGGLVPCPSAMVLLLAAIALNKTAYGMMLVLVFSVGLAVTLTAVGLLFIYARDRVRPRTTAKWPQVLPVLSAVTITAVGAALCLGALRSFG